MNAPPAGRQRCLWGGAGGGDNGFAGAVPTVLPRGQQARIPEANPGEQPGKQTLVQIVSEGPAEAAASPVRTPLLLLLLPQNSQVSALSAASQPAS